MTSGMGYHSTLAAMHQKSRLREYNRRVWGRSVESTEKGWHGCLDASEFKNIADRTPTNGDLKGKGKQKDTGEILEDNEELLQELASWQYLRLRRGHESWISDRERLVGT